MKVSIFIVLLVYFVVLSLNKVQKALVFDRVEACIVPPTSPIRIEAIVFTTVNHATYINSRFQMTRDVQRLKVAVKIIRCANKESLDTCVYFNTLRMKDTCSLVKQNGTIISSMIYAYRPPATCPLRKGPYELVNGTYDPNMVQFFPLDKWYWKIAMDLYDTDTDEYLVRLCIEGKVTPHYS